MKKEQVKLKPHGPAMDHNVLCWVCNDKSAVYDMFPNWVFRPCWECQKKGLGNSKMNFHKGLKGKIIDWLIG